MYAINHEDLGTPASPSPGTVKATIDGVAVTVPAGTSILRAAATAGNRIPKLCATAWSCARSRTSWRSCAAG
jgi:formate dehydrogenase major subunit